MKSPPRPAATTGDLIAWDPTLSVGVAEMDRQHQRLIKIINDLHKAMKARRGSEAIGAAIEELVAYVRDHFSNEEALMADHDYPELDAHMNKHNEFVSKINDFQMGFNSGKSTLTIDIMTFLKEIGWSPTSRVPTSSTVVSSPRNRQTAAATDPIPHRRHGDAFFLAWASPAVPIEPSHN